MATYPASIKSFTTKTNQVDDVDAAHMNTVQDEIVAIQTELGTDPAGSETDLKTRLYVTIDNDGALRKNTSFPGTPIDGQFFYRTDQNTAYIYNGSTWDSLGQSLSNLIFHFGSMDRTTGVNYPNFYSGTSFTPTLTSTLVHAFWGIGNAANTTAETILLTKWRKIAGVSTVSMYGRIWCSGGYGAKVKVDIGGASNTSAAVTATTPTAFTTFDVDVSGLSDGTAYDVTIQLQANNTSEANCYLSDIVGIGS